MSGMAHKVTYNTETGAVRDQFGNEIGKGTDALNKELRRVYTDSQPKQDPTEPETREERQQRALNAAFRRLAGH